MKEGHQTWNNMFMLTNGGKERGQEENFYKLMDVYLSKWFGALTLSTFGFTPQMQGVVEYVEENPDDFDQAARATIASRLANKEAAWLLPATPGRTCSRPTSAINQDWWARVQAA